MIPLGYCRVKEHATHAKNGRFDMSAAADHALNKAHHLDWEKVEIIDQGKRLMNRRVKEALWIPRREKQHEQRQRSRNRPNVVYFNLR